MHFKRQFARLADDAYREMAAAMRAFAAQFGRERQFIALDYALGLKSASPDFSALLAYGAGGFIGHHMVRRLKTYTGIYHAL